MGDGGREGLYPPHKVKKITEENETRRFRIRTLETTLRRIIFGKACGREGRKTLFWGWDGMGGGPVGDASTILYLVNEEEEEERGVALRVSIVAVGAGCERGGGQKDVRRGGGKGGDRGLKIDLPLPLPLFLTRPTEEEGSARIGSSSIPL